jgi:hypothetical protein
LRDPWLLACALHSLGLAAFHAGFWKLFDWPRSLASTTVANRAILQIANLRLIYFFFGVAGMCLVFPRELRSTPLGRALLGFMVLFWVGRTLEQWLFLRVNHAGVHALTGVFVLGAVLFAVPLAQA